MLGEIYNFKSEDKKLLNYIIYFCVYIKSVCVYIYKTYMCVYVCTQIYVTPNYKVRKI